MAAERGRPTRSGEVSATRPSPARCTTSTAATIDRLDIRAAVLARLIARPGGLVQPALQLIRSTESDDVPANIAHLDRAMDRPATAPEPTAR